MSSRVSRCLLIAASILVCAPAVRAGGPTATSAVKASQEALFALMEKAPTKDTPAMEETICDELFDYATIVQNSLEADCWVGRTPKEKDEFTTVIKKLLCKDYQARMKNMLRYPISYMAEKKDPTGAVVVRMEAKAEGDEFETDFMMVAKGGPWRAEDVVPEGVSWVTNRCANCTKVFKKQGFPALMQDLNAELAKP